MSTALRTSARLALCLGLAALAAPACTRDKPAGVRQDDPGAMTAPAGATTPGATTPGATAAPGPAADPHAGMSGAGGQGGGDVITGTVTETMDSGGYTYARVDRGGAQVWLAGPQTKLAVGDKVAAGDGMVMTNFKSETLGRTFDQIYFVGSFAGGGAPANPHAGGAVPANPHAGGAPAAGGAAMTEKVEPAEGGMPIAEMFKAKASLGGKPVAVRGKVVKVNNGIMGTNWVHLQDGTGAPGTNDLLITTDDVAKVGDVVVARGTAQVDKDFGSGYQFALMVEAAKLSTK